MILTGKGNYTGTKTAGWTMKKKDPEASDFNFSALTFDYDGLPKSVDAPTLKNGKTGCGAITVKYNGSTTSPVNPGSYAVTFDVASGTNFNARNGLKYGSGTLTINKAANPASVSLTAAVRKGGSTVDLSKYVRKGKATGAVSYSILGEKNGCSVNGSGIFTSGSTTGTVTVSVTVAADANYKASEGLVISVTVTEKDVQTLTFAKESLNKVYGDPVFTNSLTGAQTGVTYSVASGNDVAKVNTTTGAVTILKPGEAVIQADAAASGAYEAARMSYHISVDRRPVTVTANNKSMIRGEKDPVLTATVTGLLGNDKVSYTISRDPGTTPGKYAIKPTGEAIQGYYKITYINGTLTITENKPKMELNDDKLVVQAKKTSRAIKATLVNDSIKSVTVSNNAVATVSYSRDTIIVKAGKKKGKAVVTVVSAKGNKRTFNLEVQTGKVSTKKLTIKPTKKKYILTAIGQKTEPISVIATPDYYSTGDKLGVKSSKSAVATATVDQTSKEVVITAKGKGTAKITISAGKKKQVINVTVKAPVPVTGISVKPASKTIKVKGNVTLKATLIPKKPDNKTVIWSCNNNSAVKIKPNKLSCKVKGLAPGTANVTVKDASGRYSKTCTITVKPK